MEINRLQSSNVLTRLEYSRHDGTHAAENSIEINFLSNVFGSSGSFLDDIMGSSALQYQY